MSRVSNLFSVTISPLPAWMSGQALNEWRLISGTQLSTVPLMAQPCGTSYPQGKQDSWCGWHIDTRTSDIYSVGQGGHDDYWGNEVDRIRLINSAPSWVEILASSQNSAPTAGNGYYTDGRPPSVHGYHTSIFIESLNRAIRFPLGSGSRSGNPVQFTSAFNIATGAWDTEATWSGLAFPVGGRGAAEAAYAKHATTEDVYAWIYNSGIYRWNKGIPGSWTLLVSNPPAPAYYTAAAFAASLGSSGKVFFLGGGNGPVCHAYDIATNTVQAITLSGTNISSQAGIGLVFVPATGNFYACTAGAGGSTVYVITPNAGTTWSCALLSTTGGSGIPSTAGNSAYYPFTKFLYVPALGGVAFGPRWSTGIWLLRLHTV